jgi:hypothetical protein
VACYLLCFSEPLGNERHRASHYLGYSPDRTLERRIAEHLAGRGARITRVAVERGITLTVTRVWPGEDRRAERRPKDGAHPGRLCPVCRKARRGGGR